MKVKRVGVDLAKTVFQVHGVDGNEQPVWQRRLSRGGWVEAVTAKLVPGGEIGMEACAGAHHWARTFRSRGYRVKLIAPQFVKPYVKSNKHDVADAEAICEAMSRPSMRFVSVKSVEQQDIQAVHRVRAELVGQRTAKANQIRGLASEYGVVAPRELSHLRRAIPRWLENGENGLSERFRRLLDGLWSDLRRLDERVSELTAEIEANATTHPDAKRLQQLRGVGPIIATALVATMGDGAQFRRGRDFAVSLGLTPRQHSTGGKERLLGISKRGEPYLRSLLVHGERSALYAARNKDDRLSLWVKGIAARRHPNVAAVAWANKTARLAWAVVAQGSDYVPQRATA